VLEWVAVADIKFNPMLDKFESAPLLAIIERMGGVYSGEVRWRMEAGTFFEW